jgi:hypothetical protein
MARPSSARRTPLDRTPLRRTLVRLALLLATALAAPLAAARPLAAQDVETPLAFDSAGRVMVLTPPLVARLQLAPPAWPVTGDFVEARLFARPAGLAVLAVSRPDGRVERWTLTADETSALRAAVARDLAGLPPERREAAREPVSEQARTAFVRNQLWIGLMIHGPAAAALVGEDPFGSWTSYGVGGASFFAAWLATRDARMTQAQSDLATDLAGRGAAVAMALGYAVGGEAPGSRGFAAAAVAGALTGTIGGLRAGRTLTTAEARGAAFGSTALTLGALGAMASTGDASPDGWRLRTVALLGTATAGVPLGLRYVRRSRYVVTAGDLSTLQLAGWLGVSLALAPAGDAKIETRTIAARATGGWLAGLAAGDLLLVRPVDHTESEASQVALGALAGSSIGFAFTKGDDDARLAFILGATGATAGAVTMEWLIRSGRSPWRGRGSPDDPLPRRPTGPRRNARVAFDPSGLALAAAGVRGTFPVVRVAF